MRVLNPYKGIDLESVFEDVKLVNHTSSMILRKLKLKTKKQCLK